MTQEAVHHGRAERITQLRTDVLSSIYGQHPERFVSGMPKPPAAPDAAWINRMNMVEPIKRKSGFLADWSKNGLACLSRVSVATAEDTERPKLGNGVAEAILSEGGCLETDKCNLIF
jgi:hypothetical protein